MYCDIPSLGRCCFCLPLRRGVLVFGYINVLFSLLMIGIYSLCVHNKNVVQTELLYHGAVASIALEGCLVIYCIEIICNILLIYGTHTRKLLYIKLFYYYVLTTLVACVILQIIDMVNSYGISHIELWGIGFAGICIQVYLMILVRSLIKKLEISGEHVFENQLQQIVFGERAPVEGNGVYENTTVDATDNPVIYHQSQLERPSLELTKGIQ